MTKSTSTENPFRKLLAQLDHEQWQFVTLEFLKTVHDLVNCEQTLIYTYGEAFDVLRYLENSQVIELEPAEEAGVFKIRKRFY
jgi:hypothetical protein